MAKSEKIHLFVTGNVQGVGFRYATQAEARKLGLTGWVRNTPDDRVEILAQGDSGRLESFLGWCKVGPANARVRAVDVVERKAADGPALPDFEIRR